jgi:thioredoxin-dependent peroxiredoxin
MSQLKKGDKAPAFKLADQNGKTVKLGDFKGKKLLVYFYPKADTSGCTRQACSVRDAAPDLASVGLSAVGISPDPADKQAKFDAKYGLGFPLLSDPDHAVADAYGTWGEKTMYGKTYEGIIRSAFLVSEKGVIIDAWYNIRPTETVPNAKAALQATSAPEPPPAPAPKKARRASATKS